MRLKVDITNGKFFDTKDFNLRIKDLVANTKDTLMLCKKNIKNQTINNNIEPEENNEI